MKIAAIYARTATLERSSLTSIKKQVSASRKRIKKDNNLLLEDRVYVDLGYSGVKINRPALTKLLKDAKRKKFEVLYVENTDRLSRNYDQYKLLLSTLADLDIKFVSLGECSPSLRARKYKQDRKSVV